jgi:hypothetical protein
MSAGIRCRGKLILGAVMSWRMRRRFGAASAREPTKVNPRPPVADGISERRAPDTHAHRPGIRPRDSRPRDKVSVSAHHCGAEATRRKNDDGALEPRSAAGRVERKGDGVLSSSQERRQEGPVRPQGVGHPAPRVSMAYGADVERSRNVVSVADCLRVCGRGFRSSDCKCCDDPYQRPPASCPSGPPSGARAEIHITLLPGTIQ